MLGLVTDRSFVHENNRSRYAKKGWKKMTTYERALWTGNPLTARDFDYDKPVNLLPPTRDFRVGSVTLDSEITITVGAAEHFIGEKLTLSAIETSGMELLWIDGDSTRSLHTLDKGGSTLAIIGGAPSRNAVMAVRMNPGRHERVMLEFGTVRHDYVAYQEILPNEVTKGAYNYSDLNRLGRTLLVLLGEPEPGAPQIKTDWSNWDIPTKEQMGDLATNLKEAIGRAVENPEFPKALNYNFENLGREDANWIEEMLQIAYEKMISEEV